MKRAKIREIFPDATDEQISDLLGAVHAEVDSIRDENDDLKSKLEEAKNSSSKDSAGWKQKYEAEKKAFEDFKADQTAKETKGAKEKAVRDLLDGIISEKGIEKAIKYADYSTIEFDDKGKLKDASALKKSFSEEWAEYVTNAGTSGTNTAGPEGPASSGTGTPAKTKDDIMKISDPAERQAAIAENHALFGF